MDVATDPDNFLHVTYPSYPINELMELVGIRRVLSLTKYSISVPQWNGIRFGALKQRDEVHFSTYF